ncbi:hypothetical protein EAS64_33670 [Trebonia kvetii]|uniref:Uncharacterized protein n=1 Tax=Trebonia kvetii TaxID=2480626 RepID=A0A6P2BQI6_9ACTN|nr:hypothetical protein EAS64_33670 [Trebonia kvetii]
MIETVSERNTETVPTLSQPKAGSSAAARRKDRESECDPKGPVMKAPNPASVQMLIAFNALNYRVYEGTVPEAVVRRRRKRDKAARISRRQNRGRA